MSIPYRTRQGIKKALFVLLVLLVIAALVWGCWILWVSRYIIYTRDGAVLDFDLSPQLQSGQLAVMPETEETFPIRYSDGNDSPTASLELKRMQGYYVDSAALVADFSAVRGQIQALPEGTPVLVDVKNIYGGFFYSSEVGSERSSQIKEDKMDELITFLKQSDKYIIARLPALRDYAYGLHHVPDGLPTAGGYLWMDNDGCYWLNPNSQGTINYLVQIINELKELGFDEVVLSDFYIPSDSGIVFQKDRKESLSQAAKTLVTTCADDRFAVSFLGKTLFTLPEGRTRLYLEGVDAADVVDTAQDSGIAEPQIHLVFMTELHDTRFDEYSVLRPLAGAH